MDSLQRSRIGFLEALAQSQLLDESAWTQFVEGHTLQSSSDEEVAKAFVNARLLTKFQARQLLAGRWRGLTFDGYRILDSLSCGGMGEVFLARPQDRNEHVAIKVLRGRFRENAAALQRFLLEAEILTTLRHPHLLRGLSWKFFDDNAVRFPYLVLELILGPNLYEWGLLHGTMPWPQACEIVRQAALALHHAHEAGYLHRDVKPGNMLLSPRGVLKLLDFGLAKTYRTVEGAKPDQSARREDLCGLGDSWLYVVTGSTWKGKPIDSVLKSYNVPTELATIIEQLRKTPGEMTSSDEGCITTAGEVAAVLEKWCEPYQVRVDFTSLLEARNRARKQLSKLRGSTLESLKQAETPATEPAADELGRLRQLLSEMVSHLDQRRKEDLAILEQSALTKRAYEEETAALQSRIVELTAAVRDQQSEQAKLNGYIAEQQEKHAVAIEFLTKQLKGASSDAQRYQHQVQELKRELESLKLVHKTTVEQLRRELDARHQELVNSQSSQRLIREELAELTQHAERLAALIPYSGLGDTTDPLADPSLVARNPLSAISFWQAYERACLPNGSRETDMLWGDFAGSDEPQETELGLEKTPGHDAEAEAERGLSG